MKIYIGKENQALSDKEFLRKLTIPNKYKPNYVDYEGNPREYDRFTDGYDDYDNRGFAVLVYKTASTNSENFRAESVKVSTDLFPYVTLNLDMSYNEYKKVGNIFCPQVKALDEWRFKPLMFYNAETVWIKDSSTYTGEVGPINLYIRNTNKFYSPHVHSVIVAPEYDDKVLYSYNCVNIELTNKKYVDFEPHEGNVDNTKAYKIEGDCITVDRTAFRNAKDEKGKPYSMKMILSTTLDDLNLIEDSNEEFRRKYYIGEKSIGFLYKIPSLDDRYYLKNSEVRGVVKVMNELSYVDSIYPHFEIDLTSLGVGYYLFKGIWAIDTKKVYSADWEYPEGQVYINNLSVVIRVVETGNF